MNAPQKVGIGTSLNRVDGVAKVTGTAKYAAEYHVPDLLHGVAVLSAIAKGRIVSMDKAAARAVPGVIDVISHLNRPKHAWLNRSWRDELQSPESRSTMTPSCLPLSRLPSSSRRRSRRRALRPAWSRSPMRSRRTTSISRRR